MSRFAGNVLDLDRDLPFETTINSNVTYVIEALHRASDVSCSSIRVRSVERERDTERARKLALERVIERAYGNVCGRELL